VQNKLLSAFLFILLSLYSNSVKAQAEKQSDFSEIMKQELDRSIQSFSKDFEYPVYFLQYSVVEANQYSLGATNGGFEAPQKYTRRYLDVDLRVGNMELDNTHEIRGGAWFDNSYPRRVIPFALELKTNAIRAALWKETEYQYQKARERYVKVLSNSQVKVEQEDLSHDFSPIEPQKFTESQSLTLVDTVYWQGIIKEVSNYLSNYSFVLQSGVRLNINDGTKWIINTEGTRIKHCNRNISFSMSVSGIAADGMDLSRSENYTCTMLDHLPDHSKIMADAARIVEELKALRDAPIVQPYIGPAILFNRASGVFFHEIFGHRIEGHRQKSEEEGQTFTKKLNEQILPDFINIYDDPTLQNFRGDDLTGYYKFDDEGVPSQRVTVVENGILRGFLTSRSPIKNFPFSNGHGRRDFGHHIVCRQGALIIQSNKSVTFEHLRQLLIEECLKQNKPYGLLFKDIGGGMTSTQRSEYQAFKVFPLLVYRIYPDGRPDEVVRGVDIVGTPLACFKKIITTANDDEVFNGICGAESGGVPVSAISPSILVSEIEVEKQAKRQDKPPLLPKPEFNNE